MFYAVVQFSMECHKIKTKVITLNIAKDKAINPMNQSKLKVITVEPRLSGPRLTGLFDYPDFFLWSQFFHEY